MGDNDLKTPLLSVGDAFSVTGGSLKSRMDMLMREYRHFDPFQNDTFKGHTGAIWSCAMTSDNNYIFSGSEDKTVKVWDASTQSLLHTFTDHSECVNCLEVTVNDKYLISGDWAGEIFVFDYKKKIKINSLDGHTKGVYCFSMSGKWLVSGSGDFTARVWDTENFFEVCRLDCEGSSVFAVAITSDSCQIVTGGWDGTIRIFEGDSFSKSCSYPSNYGIIQCLAVTHDKQFIVFGTRKNVVNVWNFGDKTEHAVFKTHENWVRNVVTTHDNKFCISVSADKSIRIFNLTKKTEEMVLEGSDGYVFGEYLSKDGQFLLTGASDKLLRCWTIGSAIRSHCIKGHEKPVISITISKDNQWIASGSEDKTVRIWNISSKQEVARHQGHTETVWGVCFTHDLNYLLSVSGDKTAILWNFKSQKIEAVFLGHLGQVFSITVTLDNKFIVTGSQDKSVGVWNIETRENLKFLEGHTDAVFTVKVTNDNKFIVSGAADYTIRMWDLFRLVQVKKFETKSGMIESIALSYNDKYLVFGDRSNKVYLWDWAEKAQIKKFVGHSHWVKSVDFAVDGTLFASGSNDGSIRLWNASEQRHEIILIGHTSEVRTVAFTSNGKYVASAGDDSMIRLWNIKDVGMMEVADIGNSLDTYLYLSKIKTGKNPTTDIVKTVFGALKINLAHFYSYLGHEDLLKKALDLGTDIRIDEDGNSPLHYALIRSSQGCVDTILQYLIDVKGKDMEKFLDYINAIRNDLNNLLKNHSILLPEFLESIFYSVPNVNNFAVPLQELPMLIYSNDKRLNLASFVYDSNENLGEKEVPIEFKTLPFAIPFVLGSSDSIELLMSISNCPNQLILKTEFVKTYVRNKWNNLWLVVLLMTFLMWLNLFVMVSMVVLGSFHPESSLSMKYLPLGISFILINSLLALYETIQAFSVGFRYFTDFWNIIDILRFSICGTWSVLVFTADPDNIHLLTWVMSILNFFRCLSGFRAFDDTRFYTRLIFRAVTHALPFILVFFYSTLAFGVIMYTSKTHTGEATNQIFSLWKSPYALNMGDFGDDEITESPLTYLYFMMASVINVIIMLNLLISILGDSFESFLNEAQEIDVMEMANFVIELESLMFWNKKHNQKKFIHKCEHQNSLEHGKWEGRVKAIQNTVERARKESNLRLARIEEKLDKLLEK